MSYYSGNIPPEKAGMFPPGAYPPSVTAAGTYLPAQSGLPSQPGYLTMAQGYPATLQGYTQASAYAAQAGYPGGVSAHGHSAGAFQTMGYPALGITTQGYPASQGYPPGAAGYPSTVLTTQSPYGSAHGLPPSNPLYAQGSASPYAGMSVPAGRGYPMAAQMYPGSAYGNPYPGPSPYGPPYN